jgi:hypothetical protein
MENFDNKFYKEKKKDFKIGRCNDCGQLGISGGNP